MDENARKPFAVTYPNGNIAEPAGLGDELCLNREGCIYPAGHAALTVDGHVRAHGDPVIGAFWNDADAEPAPEPTEPGPGSRVIPVSELPDNLRQALAGFFGGPCGDPNCDLHGRRPAAVQPPRVRILRLPAGPVFPGTRPPFALIVDREPLADDEVARELWTKRAHVMGTSALILDSRELDVPEADPVDEEF